MDNIIENSGVPVSGGAAHGTIEEAVESLVDRFVTGGLARPKVLDAVRDCIDRVREAGGEDPDPAEETTARAEDAGVPLMEPANDWPSS